MTPNRRQNRTPTQRLRGKVVSMLQAKQFVTTHWSLVLRAGASAETEDTQTALGELIQRYWYPLYAFCRRKGNNDHDAMDLTQGFFAHLLSGDALGTVSPEKGRFRA